MINLFPLTFFIVMLLVLAARDCYFNDKYVKCLSSNESLETKVSRLKKTSRYRSGTEDVFIAIVWSLAINGVFYYLISL